MTAGTPVTFENYSKIHALLIVQGPVVNGQTWSIDYFLTFSPSLEDDADIKFGIYLTLIPGGILFATSFLVFEVPYLYKKRKLALRKKKEELGVLSSDDNNVTGNNIDETVRIIDNSKDGSLVEMVSVEDLSHD